MDEQDFRLLLILAETGNITHAADRLYITQSSVSKRIRQMEQELGTALLVRSRQGVHFTPAGEIVLQHVKGAVQQLGSMRQEVNQSRGDVAGTIRVGTSINYGMYRLPKQLKRYQALYPLVHTQVVTDSSQKIFADLLKDRYDVVVARGEFDWHGKRVLLDRERVCAITSAKDAERPLDSLPQITRRTDLAMEREIAQWMRENHIAVSESSIVVNSTATCVEMVRRGLGWGVVPEICLTDFPGSIRPLVLADGEPLVRSTYLMYTEKARELPQVQAFIALLRQMAGGRG